MWSIIALYITEKIQINSIAFFKKREREYIYIRTVTVVVFEE